MLLRPIFDGPVTTACECKTQPSPSSTSSPTTAYGPICTPDQSFAVGATDACTCICATLMPSAVPPLALLFLPSLPPPASVRDPPSCTSASLRRTDCRRPSHAPAAWRNLHRANSPL